MERLTAAVVLLVCFAGYGEGAGALKDACSPTSPCATGLTCQYGTCRANIGTNCATAASTNECVMNYTCTTAGQPCACPTPATQVASADNTKCYVKAGSTCTATGVGCVMQASCTGATGAMTCTCNSGYMQTADFKCLAKIGSNCTAVTDCYAGDSMNGACTNSKCACKANFVANYVMTMCKVAPAQTCTIPPNDNCAENSACNATTTKCDCMSEAMVSHGRCAKPTDSTCTSDSQCGLMATCPAGTGTRKCTCKTNYVMDSTSKFCKESSGSAIFASLLTVMAVFVTSKLF